MGGARGPSWPPLSSEIEWDERQAPIRVVEAVTAWVLNDSSAATWADSEDAGTAAARPHDLVIPNVKAGDAIPVAVNIGLISAGTNGKYLDIWSIVDGAPVNHMATQALGGSWDVRAAAAHAVNGVRTFYVTEDDIDDGSLRLRLRHTGNAAGTAQQLFGGFGLEICLEAHPPLA